MNNYKENATAYVNSGYSLIPDKFRMKQPAIRDWTRYCSELPTSADVAQSSEIGDTNVAVCCGEASGIVVLDFDCEDTALIEKIEPYLPPSPVERVGAKGWARFFRYNGEHNDIIRYNGKVVFEILSNGKKCTIPPSTHPNGMLYKWTDKSLLEVDRSELPLLPPVLLETVRQVLLTSEPSVAWEKPNKAVNGRNGALVSLCGKLIAEAKSVDQCVKELVEYDEQHHTENPYFSDVSEHPHTERFTNALALYSSVLSSVNLSRLRKSLEYEVPVTASAINQTALEEVVKKKEHQKEIPESAGENLTLPKPSGLLAQLQEFILSRSFVKQPELALSASLGLISVLIGRKLTFVDNAPNLFLLNVAPSGAGKDAPQQAIKNILIDLQLTGFLGSGDYVSDASLMDSLPHNPVRLDIIDEASGLLKSVNKGANTYDGKMADILCELYTSSNNRFLGRALANGETKGEVDRPCVSLLMSTTPRGFTESLSIKAVEKGLLGRTLIFDGNPHNEATRIKEFPKLDSGVKNKLLELANYEVGKSETKEIAGIKQLVKEVEATPEANKLLDEVFMEFDELRRSEEALSLRLPIIARLFQQTCKIALISAASRCAGSKIMVGVDDVRFARSVAIYSLGKFESAVQDNMHDSRQDAYVAKIKEKLRSKDGKGATLNELLKRVRFGMDINQKRSIIGMMVELGEIYVQPGTRSKMKYFLAKEESDD